MAAGLPLAPSLLCFPQLSVGSLFLLRRLAAHLSYSHSRRRLGSSPLLFLPGLTRMDSERDRCGGRGGGGRRWAAIRGSPAKEGKEGGNRACFMLVLRWLSISIDPTLIHLSFIGSEHPPANGTSHSLVISSVDERQCYLCVGRMRQHISRVPLTRGFDFIMVPLHRPDRVSIPAGK